jgi:hypothetical protein
MNWVNRIYSKASEKAISPEIWQEFRKSTIYC